MNNISLKSGFNAGAVVLAVAALIAVPLRTVQFFTVLEGGTGFYTEMNWSVYLFFAVLIAAFAAFAVLGISKRKKLSYSTEPERRAGFGALSGLAAAGFIFDAFNCFTEFTSEAYAVPEYLTASEETSSLATASLLLKLEAVFAVLSALYLLILCLCNLMGKAPSKAFSLLSLSPVIWCIFKLVFRFMRTISYVKVSDLMLEMLALVFLVLFFMAFAQLNSGISSKGCEWKIAAYGSSAALLLLVCFIPRFIVTLSGNADLIYSMSKAEYCDICIALFIICTVATRITDKKPEEPVIIPVAEAVTEE